MQSLENKTKMKLLNTLDFENQYQAYEFIFKNNNEELNKNLEIYIH